MLKNLRYAIYRKLLNYGFDGKKFVRAIKKPDWFTNDIKELNRQKGSDTTFEITKLFPMLNDRDEPGGIMSGSYFHQDLFVARKIFEANPIKHLDVGSQTHSFVAHVASFREIEMIDIRDIKSTVKNIQFRKADLMQLPEDLIEAYDSISSLHAVEHFGLGRYGDPVDYWGYLKGIENMTRMLKPGGTFYFSVPIGPQRIEFNAHRVFSVGYLLSVFSKTYTCLSFSYVDERGDLHEDVPLADADVENNFGCRYGCGIFILSKNQASS